MHGIVLLLLMLRLVTGSAAWVGQSAFHTLGVMDSGRVLLFTDADLLFSDIFMFYAFD